VSVGIAVAAVVLGVGTWWHNTQWAGWHVRKCGFDSQGHPYAVVRDNTIGGAKHEQIRVQFGYDRQWNEDKEPAASSVRLPTIFGHAIGGVTTVVHGTWPRQEPNSPAKLSCVLGGHGNNDYN
jgi:hypothetical protein